MDCRTARALMADEAAIASDEQQAYDSHLATCAACRDDAADPISRALSQTMIEMALPPPDFTAKLLQRLPGESPFAIAARESRQRQRLVRSYALAGGAVFAIFALLGIVTRTAWTGTTLGLIADALGTIATAAIAPLAVMLVSALAIALLLHAVIKQPTPFRAMSAAGLALALLVSSGVVTALNDQGTSSANDARVTSPASLFRPIETAFNVPGNVVSLAGDILVRGDVGGNVASLFGDVTIERGQVAGNVLAGSGAIDAPVGAIAGRAVRGPAGVALTGLLGETTTQELSPGVVRSLTGLLGALVTLALAALVVMLWPHRTLRSAHLLPTKPWLALGLGVLITALLALLSLPLLALLALTVVGLLLVPLLLMVVHLPYVQGLAAVGQALGQRLTGNVTTTSALWGVAAQLVLVVGIGMFAPLAGLTTFYLLGSLGLGALVLDRRALI